MLYYILCAIAGIFVGFFVGVVLYRETRRRRQHISGAFIIADDRELGPQIFLECADDPVNFVNGQVVLIEIRRKNTL